MSAFDLKVWAVILGLAGATYLIRLSFLGLLAGRTLPPWFIRALGFVPVTVLPALVAPMILYAPGDALGGTLAEPHRWVAALVTVGVGIWSRHLTLSFAAGCATFAALRALGL